MAVSARVARLCLPGPMWYVAVCSECRWAGLDWKHRMWANGERDLHNTTRHASPEAATFGEAMLSKKVRSER